MESSPSPPWPTCEAVFIGGCPRSGTTLLGTLLAQMPGCVVTPESPFKQLLLRDHRIDWQQGLSSDVLRRDFQGRRRFRLWQTPLPDTLPERLSREDYRQLLVSLAANFRRDGAAADAPFTWIDHTPHNLQSVLLLSELFPSARFVHLVRDPRAIAASVLPLDWGPEDTRTVGRYWSQHLAHGLAAELQLPKRVIRLHFEDLVDAPEPNLKALCAFCGLNYNASSLQGGDASFLPAFSKQQHRRVGQPPDPSRARSWQRQLTPWQIQEVEHGCGDLLALLGYAAWPGASPASSGRPGRLRRHLLPPLRRSLKALRYWWRRRS